MIRALVALSFLAVTFATEVRHTKQDQVEEFDPTKWSACSNALHNTCTQFTGQLRQGIRNAKDKGQKINSESFGKFVGCLRKSGKPSNSEVESGKHSNSEVADVASLIQAEFYVAPGDKCIKCVHDAKIPASCHCSQVTLPGTTDVLAIHWCGKELHKGVTVNMLAPVKETEISSSKGKRANSTERSTNVIFILGPIFHSNLEVIRELVDQPGRQTKVYMMADTLRCKNQEADTWKDQCAKLGCYDQAGIVMKQCTNVYPNNFNQFAGDFDFHVENHLRIQNNAMVAPHSSHGHSTYPPYVELHKMFKAANAKVYIFPTQIVKNPISEASLAVPALNEVADANYDQLSLAGAHYRHWVETKQSLKVVQPIFDFGIAHFMVNADETMVNNWCRPVSHQFRRGDKHEPKAPKKHGHVAGVYDLIPTPEGSYTNMKLCAFPPTEQEYRDWVEQNWKDLKPELRLSDHATIPNANKQQIRAANDIRSVFVFQDGPDADNSLSLAYLLRKLMIEGDVIYTIGRPTSYCVRVAMLNKHKSQGEEPFTVHDDKATEAAMKDKMMEMDFAPLEDHELHKMWPQPKSNPFLNHGGCIPSTAAGEQWYMRADPLESHKELIATMELFNKLKMQFDSSAQGVHVMQAAGLSGEFNTIEPEKDRHFMAMSELLHPTQLFKQTRGEGLLLKQKWKVNWDKPAKGL